MDFTTLPIRKKTYGGVNGGKIAVVYQEEIYMLKFPPKSKFNQGMSYMNSCFSEYIGSHIFQSVGMKAQDTLLGTFKLDGEEKIVVACKDFTQNNVVLQDFAS